MLYMNGIFEAIETKKDIKVGDRIIHITPKLTKRDFFESLNDMGKESEKEYFECFGYSPLAIRLYPTIRGIKQEYNISYKELSNVGKQDIKLVSKRLGHSTVDTILKYYKSNDTEKENPKSKKNHQNVPKELPSFDYLEFIIHFGDNKELYDELKPLKEKASCSWEYFRNMKWKDVDLEKGTMCIESEEIDIC